VSDSLAKCDCDSDGPQSHSDVSHFQWNYNQTYLVGGFNPFEKYARQIGSFPQVGVKIKICETTTQKPMKAVNPESLRYKAISRAKDIILPTVIGKVSSKFRTRPFQGCANECYLSR